jgi:hypothetical protein
MNEARYAKLVPTHLSSTTLGLAGRGEPGVYTALLSAPRALSPKVSHTWMVTGSKEQATNGVVRKVVVLCRAGARAAYPTRRGFVSQRGSWWCGHVSVTKKHGYIVTAVLHARLRGAMPPPPPPHTHTHTPTPTTTKKIATRS